VGLHPDGSGNCSAIACSVALGLGSEQAPLGERSRLVEAHRVDASQPFDGGQFLHQHLAPAETDYPNRECDGGEKDEPLGDHRHKAGDAEPDGFLDVRPSPILVVGPAGEGGELAPDEEQGCGYQNPCDAPQDPVDAGTQFRADQSELAGLFGKPGGISIRTHPPGLVDAGPGRHETPGQHFVAAFLHDGVRFTGEERLIDLEALRSNHDAVDNDLVAGLEGEQVVEDHHVDRHFAFPAVADHAGPGCAQQREVVEGFLGPEFLDDPDGGVSDQDESEHRILDRSDDQDDHQHCPEQDVEEGDDVGLDDLADCSGRAGRDLVDGTRHDARGHVCIAEACEGRPPGPGFCGSRHH